MSEASERLDKFIRHYTCADAILCDGGKTLARLILDAMNEGRPDGRTMNKIDAFIGSNYMHSMDDASWRELVRLIIDAAKEEIRAEMRAEIRSEIDLEIDLRLAASKPPADAPQGDADRPGEPTPRRGCLKCDRSWVQAFAPKYCPCGRMTTFIQPKASEPAPDRPEAEHGQATVGHARVPTPNTATCRQGEQPTHSWEMTLDEIPVAPQGLPEAGAARHGEIVKGFGRDSETRYPYRCKCQGWHDEDPDRTVCARCKTRIVKIQESL